MPPAVDDVADQVERVGVVVAEEVEHQLGLAAARAEVHVRDEDRAVAVGGRRFSGSFGRADMAIIRSRRILYVSAQILMSSG